ncbi:MAG: DUF5709 domain-containing protein [Streptosporangiaceae bacterium]
MSDDEDYDPDDYDEFQDEGSLDASDTLEGKPGDDPLDAGILPADKWSAGMRFGSTAAEEEEGESLDQLLSEEEPDVLAKLDKEDEDDESEPDDDEDAADEDLDGLLLDDGPDPRSGRLVAEDEGAHSVTEPDLVARDAGIDGGAASAEEAAVHTVDDDDTDIRSGD